MSYPVTFYGLEGQAGLYARIMRKDDGKWWDEVANVWIATATSNCDLALTEDSAEAGKYTITDATFSARPGGKYVTYIYDSADVFVFYTENTYSATQPKTTIQIVQNIQKELRLPQAVTALTKAHDILVLAFVNKVIVSMNKTPERWDALKISGGFMTEANKAIYTIDPINAVNMASITHLQIGTSEPIAQFVTEEEFREYKRTNTTPSQPLARRIYGRVGRAIMIELVPTPDDAYQVDFEGYQKAVKLVNVGDIPIFDPDTIENGGLMLAKEEQGLDPRMEAEIFNHDLGDDLGEGSEGNVGDLNPI